MVPPIMNLSIRERYQVCFDYRGRARVGAKAAAPETRRARARTTDFILINLPR